MSEYIDDPEIVDEDILWRRIPPDWVVWDENLGRFRPTSQTFQDSQNGTPMSMFVERISRELERGPKAMLEDHEKFCLVSLTAAELRGRGLALARLPDDPDGPAHVFVAGKKTGGTKKFLYRSAEWVILSREQSELG